MRSVAELCWKGRARAARKVEGALALALGIQLVAASALAEEKAEEKASEVPKSDPPAELPQVPVGELSVKSPQPSWDTGLLLGVCGVGEKSAWDVTKFCLGGLVDVMFLREEEDEAGVGGYLEVGTAGFRDVRVSGGVTSVFSLIDWFSLSVRAGGLGVLSPLGAQPGVEGYLGLGHRSVSLRSAYGLSHSLFAGMQYALPNGELPGSHAIWFGLQVDGVWFTAPLGLFR